MRTSPTTHTAVCRRRTNNLPRLLKMPAPPPSTDTSKPRSTKRPMTEIIASKPSLPSLVGESNRSSKAWLLHTTYLRSLCPPSSYGRWSRPRKFGRNLGFQCECPTCEERPPHHIPPWNRWRWMSLHMASAHRGRLMNKLYAQSPDYTPYDEGSFDATKRGFPFRKQSRQ